MRLTYEHYSESVIAWVKYLYDDNIIICTDLQLYLNIFIRETFRRTAVFEDWPFLM
jgi:hypothetical protein